MEFKDRLKPKENKSSKWFEAPSRDVQSASDYNTPGTYWGSGVRQPVGSEQRISESPIPQKSKCFAPKIGSHD